VVRTLAVQVVIHCHVRVWLQSAAELVCLTVNVNVLSANTALVLLVSHVLRVDARKITIHTGTLILWQI